MIQKSNDKNIKSIRKEQLLLIWIVVAYFTSEYQLTIPILPLKYVWLIFKHLAGLKEKLTLILRDNKEINIRNWC